MFKIESFITPLILRNVEKFVKNVHPRDSQVSLWGGEAVFNNLDLRLDVLEHELQLPFSFINGHIHELRINVPWTKLGSEPIVVTINTFECIVKLKDESDSENIDSQSEDSIKTKRKLPRLEVEDAPPSYVQSLINRITNNITVVCNNVILKYVEGDIVLSINVKSAQLHSANEKWEKAYIDLTPADLATRKLINLIDITICLDQRNASGKIETYQEPLLYRSSMEGRLYLAYDSVNAKNPTVTRCDFKCDLLEISISDQQLPMFLRLVQLCLALYFGDLVIQPKNPSSETSSIELPSTEGDDEQTWGSWAWSLVPQVNAIWEDEEQTDEDGGSGPQPPHPVFQFGAHLHRVSVTCKLTEVNSNQKTTFRPFAQLNIEGLFVDAVVREPDCVNIQLGASAIQAVSLSDCVCSGPFFAKEQYEEPILAFAGQLGCNELSYLEQTLFNELSPENQRQRRDYNYDWEEHFADLTENKLLKRSPAAAVDYFYLLLLPEDQPDDVSACSFNDLEDSNLKEKLKVRVVMGPCEINLTGGFAHRLQKFIACAFNRDFEPYSNTKKGPYSGSKHSMPTAEDIALMEEFIPFKNYVLTIIQPTLRLFATDHPYSEVNALPVQPRKKSKSVTSSFESNFDVSTRPVIVAQVNRIEIQQIVPMYAKRVVKVASTMCPISDHFLYNSQSHVTAKLFSAEVNLAIMKNNKCENTTNIVPPLSVAYYLKELQHPTMWNNPFQPKIEQFVEMARFTTHLTWPQILLMSGILNSWYRPCAEKIKFLQTSLLHDALTADNVFPSVEFSITGVQCKYSMNDAVHSAIAWLSTCRLGLQYWKNNTFSNVNIFHGPEEKENIYSVDFFKELSQIPAVDFLLASSDQCVKTVVQFPINMDSCSAPTIFLMSVKGLSFCMDPALFDWLDYFPSVPVEVITTINRETPVKDDLVEVQSKDSAPSSAQLTGITESQTQPNQKQSTMEKLSITKEIIADFCLRLFPIMKRLLIEVQLETCTIFLPTNSISISPNSTNIIRGMHKMFTSRSIPDTLVVNLPRVLIHSGTQKQNLHVSIDDIPIYTLEGLNLSQDLFPWTLTLCSFSIYTLNSKKEAIYCLNPLSSSATIALTSEPTIEDKISKINLCVHADTKSVHVKLADKQVKTISTVLQIILNALSKFATRTISAKNLFAITLGDLSSEISVNLDKSAASVSQVEVMSSSVVENNVLMSESEKSNVEFPKYSIWMQWTLPKLTVELYSSHAHLLSLDLEELVLSIDVQDVYSKIKLKLTSFNWNHYQKDDSSVQWSPGPFKGIFFTCSDKLSKSVYILNPKTDTTDVSGSFNLFETSSKTTKTTYNFLTVTFTRALSKNVQRRWTQLLREHNDQLDSKLVNSQPDHERYVSEIDIKIRSFDCVLWCPVLVKGYEILEPLFQLKFPFFNSPTPKLFTEVEDESTKAHFLMFNNNNLPLLYLNSSAIRVFVPKGFEKSEENIEDMCVFQIEKIVIASQVENPLTRIILRPDVYSLAQQARIIHVPGSEVEDRQYQFDVSGISVSTGSWEELVKRSSINKRPSVSSQLKTMGENPALEWNNKSIDTLIDTDIENDFIFMPLVDKFNARILVAPAIVYQQIIPVTKKRDDILVSGNSFEVNLTSDVDLYINLKQLSLLFNICQENILSFGHLIRISTKEVNVQLTETKEKEIETPSSSWTLNEPLDSGIEIRLDSGTESEISTLQKESTITNSTPVVAFVPPADVIIEQQQMLSQTSEPKWRIENIVPFETLFTARRFTFTAYADKLTRSESRVKEEKKTPTFVPKKRRPKRKSCHTVGKRSDLEWRSLEEQEKLNELNLKSGEVEVSSLHDGYDGSEEDSVEECVEAGDKNSSDSVSIPILYLMISQPHAFLRCRHSTSKLEISCFDVSIKGNNDKIFIPDTKFIPNAADYPVFWFETKPGDEDAKTGIPPALITISVNNFLMGSTDIKMSLDRPLKLNLSLLKYEQILDYIRAASSVTFGSIESSKFEFKFKQKSSMNIEDLIEKIRHFATYFRFIHFASVQVVVALETVPHKENAFVVISWDDVNGTVKFIEGKNELIDEISLGLSMENFGVKTSYNNHLRSLLQPVSCVISSNAIWDFWNKSTIYPRTCTSIETEAAMVYFGKETWFCYLKMITHLEEFFKSFKSESSSTKSTSSTRVFGTTKSQLESQEQTWHDDLRVGRFQYIQDSDDAGLQPEPNEIVFCREQVGQSASMTWCYEEPRALTRVEIYPVPFRTASDTGIQGTIDNKDEVGCVLQYWDPLTRSYVTCRHFNLSETQHCNLNLPRISYGDTKQKLFISRRWRVILDYYDPNEEESEEPIIRRSLVSPLALAACMRVDSYFNPTLIPIIQTRLAVELIHVNFTNHLHHDAKGIPLILNPFSWDGVTPRDQDFFTIIYQNSSVCAYAWQNWAKIEINTVFSGEVLEYGSLTMRPFVEPCLGNAQWVYSEEQNMPPIRDWTIRFGPLLVHIGQSLIHTLNAATSIFSQRTDSSNRNDLSQPLLSYYAICNDTQETIRFGQVNLDENIVLGSRQVHAYSWRSHRSKQLLHVCVEGMQWKWCEPFSIDKIGTEIRVMEQKGQRVILIIKIKKLNVLQKQIIISGQLVFANRLNQHIEVKLTPVFHANEDDRIGGEQNFLISQQSSAATCISEPGTRKAFRVRCAGSTWSEEIYFPQKTLVIDSTLVKIFLRDDQYFKFWCHFFVQSVGSTCQMLVLFTPVYIVQTHLAYPVNLILTTPGLGQTHCVQVDGYGQEFQLHCPGDSDVTHQLSFQSSPGLATSQPALPLSVNMISQVTKLPYPSKINIDEMTLSWMSNHSLLWPYDDKDFHKKVKNLPPGIAECILKSQKPQIKRINYARDQPNIDLEVCLAQRWPACNTLLIDVKPWGLIVNRSSIDLLLKNNEDLEWKIIDGEAFACPKLKEYFILGVELDGGVHYSDKLQLTDEDWSFRRYLPKIAGSLPEKGFLKCDIRIKGDNHAMLCSLTITTNKYQGIRIIQIQPTINIVNTIKTTFKCVTLTSPATDEKVAYSPQTLYPTVLKPIGELDRNAMQSLLFWESFQPEVIYYSGDEDHVKYLSLCYSTVQNNLENWSLPCRIQTHSSITRQTIVVPLPDEEIVNHCGLPLVTRSFVITVHELDAVTYLVINEDKNPQTIIHNLCTVGLHFGQTNQRSSDLTVEEMEIIDYLPLIASMSACHYTLPQISKNFPSIHDPETLAKLQFAKVCEQNGGQEDEEEFEEFFWSSGVDISNDGDLFLNIPNYSDVRIHVETVAHVVYLFVEPVSRVEVSAKEIRGRIQTEEQVMEHKIFIRPELTKSKKRLHSGSNTKETKSLQQKQQKFRSMPEKEHEMSLSYLAVYSKQVCFILIDEITKRNTYVEILRITGDDVIFSERPKVEVYGKNKRVKTRIKKEIVICGTQLQLDNQMSNEGNYDYPVVVIPQKRSQDEGLNINDNISFEILLQAVKNNAFICIETVTEIINNEETSGYEKVTFTVKPVAFYIEDTFLYKVIDIFDTYKPNSVTNSKWKNFFPRIGKIPVRCFVMSKVYRSPYIVEKLSIEPTEVLLSIHASLKICVSLVETPLSFKKFEKCKLITTDDRIGNAIVMHYLSGALIRAGWVVGSIDLLGNPGGFARAVGSGVADFVRLPYQGFFRGPWAFISGVAYGSSSLLRQISGGSIFSITNLASSVSRNMERLSLDETYRLQNEESRRHKPDNLTEGLSQGLTGLGISLLGAIAGIVDQPIQSIQKAVEEESFPPTAAVTGLISGVSKGLVGIVAKPVGGAAEFVAQAGQGILHGTGWSQILKPRFEGVNESIEHNKNSRLKYSSKMLTSLPLHELITAIEATQFNQTGRYVPCVLLLTTQVLFLVNIDEDTQQQAFLLSELDCHGLSSDPTLIYLIPIQKISNKNSQSEERTQDRVVDFVSKSTKYAGVFHATTDESESLSDSSTRLTPPPEQLAASLKFFVNPPLRNIFVSLFNSAKRQFLGKGFSSV